MTLALDGRLIEALRELEAVFEELQLKAVFIGGIAVSLLASPRATEDVEDIRNIGMVYDKLDRKRIKFWLEQYGEMLDVSDLWHRTQMLLP